MSPALRSLKQPVLKLNRLIGHSTAKNHMSKSAIGNLDKLHDEADQRELRKAQKEYLKDVDLEAERDRLERKQEQEAGEEERIRAGEPEHIRQSYGCRGHDGLPRPHSTSVEKIGTEGNEGDEVVLTVRVHQIRPMSSKLAFLVLRDQIDTIQGVLEVRENEIVESFVRWAEHLTSEDIVQARGRLQRPKEPVTGCTIHHLELVIDSMHLLVGVRGHLPIDVHNIDKLEDSKEADEVDYAASGRVREANRVSFLRTPTMQSVFRIKAGVCNHFRSFLDSQGFLEIHTSKLQPAATESGAEVFQVNYFGRKAFLAQSPQLAKQLCISADFQRVYEIGPVFRAEDSNTHRHLTEYIGMDLEMVIEQDYHEALDIIDELLKSTFETVYSRYRREVDIVKTHFPHDDLIWLETTPRLQFKEAIRLLNESGWTDEQGRKTSEYEDLSTRAEIRLGELVKEKYKTDYYILDKFPASARPFYTHLDPSDSKFTNSFDIFLRGQEITTGGQRINNAKRLAERMEQIGIDPTALHEYMSGFEYGVLPHAGCGIGLERVLMLLLNLRDIRNTTLFPRDPKSLPTVKPTQLKLRHPEADTIGYSVNYQRQEKNQELPSLEKLIANYGDASNTSWLDDRYHVWRHEATGAAVGYASESGYAIILGNPLCDQRQYLLVIVDFLRELKASHLRPLWLLVDKEVEEILGGKLGWRTMSCVAEERVGPESTQTVMKKRRQAEEAGIRIHELGLGEEVPMDLRKKCDKRIEDWKASRQGTQVHITEVRPWIDLEHRRFVWAETADGDVAALVVLHQLSPEHGYQVKFALDFPGAPSGTIELAIASAIQKLAKTGVSSVTFGTGATTSLEIGRNIDKVRVKIIQHVYSSITQQLKLVQKSEFREKFGTLEDRVYICYPRLGLGVSGARTLIKFFEDEM